MLDVHDEIQTALSQPSQTDDDLEKELEELLKRHELPEVPKQPISCEDDDLEARLNALSVSSKYMLQVTK